ncbi:hypothetical protein NDU88_002187 [Pleurodeles waltl]|uniref:Uncharacterized protein n=1 Tax=Pleurodeles waltl TaxID=8319 RepID=A0AAV7S9P8_PLEWA|nr:hypothetical protein NDU88_002187 [Pleurodeles waltl]
MVDGQLLIGRAERLWPGSGIRDAGRKQLLRGRGKSGDLDQSDSPGGTKDTEEDALSCLSAKTARLRGQARLWESGDQVQRQSHPVGPKMLKNAHGCISAKAAQLRGRARPRGTWTSINTQFSRAGLKGVNNPQKTLTESGGSRAVSSRGGAPRGKEENQDLHKKMIPTLRSFSRCIRHGGHLVKAARISGKNHTSRGGTPVGKGLTEGRKERQLIVERKQRQGGIEISSPKEQPSSMAARRRCRAVLKPSPDRRLTETRSGSSTPPGLGASNSSSALLEPGTYGPKQRGEIPGSPCCHPRTERTGDPERLSLKPSPPSGRIRDKGLYLIALRCSAASGAFLGQMHGGCVRMSDPGRIPDVQLLQERTLPHASSEAIRSCGMAHEDRAHRRERCSPRCRRPGSLSGALLPSPWGPGSPSGALFPSSRETGLSVGSAAPLAARDWALPSGALIPSSRETRLTFGSAAGLGSTVGSADSLVAGDQAPLRERCWTGLYRRER